MDDDVRCVMQEMLAFIKATKWFISCRCETVAACIAYACVYTFQDLWIVDNERNMAIAFSHFSLFICSKGTRNSASISFLDRRTEAGKNAWDERHSLVVQINTQIKFDRFNLSLSLAQSPR